MMVSVNTLADMYECVHINAWVSDGGLLNVEFPKHHREGADLGRKHRSQKHAVFSLPK